MKKKKQNKKEPDYQNFFTLGIIFVGVGVVFMASVNAGLGGAFIGLGILWMLIGRKKGGKK